MSHQQSEYLSLTIVKISHKTDRGVKTGLDREATQLLTPSLLATQELGSSAFPPFTVTSTSPSTLFTSLLTESFCSSIVQSFCSCFSAPASFGFASSVLPSLSSFSPPASSCFSAVACLPSSSFCITSEPSAPAFFSSSSAFSTILTSSPALVCCSCSEGASSSAFPSSAIRVSSSFSFVPSFLDSSVSSSFSLASLSGSKAAESSGFPSFSWASFFGVDDFLPRFLGGSLSGGGGAVFAFSLILADLLGVSPVPQSNSDIGGPPALDFRYCSNCFLLVNSSPVGEVNMISFFFALPPALGINCRVEGCPYLSGCQQNSRCTDQFWTAGENSTHHA
nr:hypothetical protein KK1_047036 [Ipomoea batatas]